MIPLDKSKCQLNSWVEITGDARPRFIDCACGLRHPITYVDIPQPVLSIRTSFTIPQSLQPATLTPSTELKPAQRKLLDSLIDAPPTDDERDEEREFFGSTDWPHRAPTNDTKENPEGWLAAIEKNHIETRPLDAMQRLRVLKLLKHRRYKDEYVPSWKREPSREDIRRFVDRTVQTYNQMATYYLLVGLGVCW